MRSLRKLSAVTFTGTAFLLAALILTGVRHNNLALDYSTIVQKSESTIFLYRTIQDQATEGLLSLDRSQLLGAAKELEHLQSRYVALLDNPLIPTQYKLTFLHDLDLSIVVVNLRNLAEKPSDVDLPLRIMGQLRHMNNLFLQFDRIVVNEMRNRVMEYQKMALILMGMIIFLTCFSLIILYSKSVKPVIVLASQAEQALQDGTPLALSKNLTKSAELKILITVFNLLLKNDQITKPEDSLYNRRETNFSAVINEATNRINGIINYSQLLLDSLDEENTNEDKKKLLEKIIDNGEQCAVILRKGIQ